MCFCAESRYSRDLLVFSNPWDTGFPAKISGKKPRGLHGGTTRAFIVRTCVGRVWCCWGVRLLLQGVLVALPLHLQMHKDGRKERDLGLIKGKGSGRDRKVL